MESKPPAANHHGEPRLPAALSRNLTLGIGLSLLAFATLIATTWRPDSYRALVVVKGRPLLAALAALAGSWGLNTLRAWLVARSLGHPIRGWVAFRAVMAGSYAAALTPFAGGGGPVEALVLSQGGLPYPLALASVTASGIVAQFVLLAAALAVVFSPIPLPGLPVLRLVLKWLLALYAAGLAAVVAALLRLELLAGPIDRLLGWLQQRAPRAARQLARWRVRSRAFLTGTSAGIRTVLQHRPAVVAALAAIYLGYYLLIFLVAPIIGLPMGLDLPPGVILAAQFPLFLLAATVPTPGGSGGIEAAMAAMVAPHLPLPAVGVFVTAWRVLTLYPSMAVGAVAAVSSLRATGQNRSRAGRLHSPA